VPPGFTLSTAVCQSFQKDGDLSEEMWKDVKKAVERIEKDTGKGYGDPQNPLLFSCRSGAAISMPGMMDTVLNIVRAKLRRGRLLWNGTKTFILTTLFLSHP
jgi:pyruvate, orthophosphate dikinase